MQRLDDRPGIAELAAQTRAAVAAMRADLFGPDRLVSILVGIGGEPSPGCPVAKALADLAYAGSLPSPAAMLSLEKSAPEFAKTVIQPSS